MLVAGASRGHWRPAQHRLWANWRSRFLVSRGRRPGLAMRRRTCVGPGHWAVHCWCFSSSPGRCASSPSQVRIEALRHILLSVPVSRRCFLVPAGLHFTYPGDKRRAARDELLLLGTGSDALSAGMPHCTSLPRSTSCSSGVASSSEESPFLAKHKRNHMI